MDTTTPAGNLSDTREHEVLSAAARRRRHDLAQLHAAFRDHDSMIADGPTTDDLFVMTEEVLDCEDRATQATQAWNEARRRDSQTYQARIAAHHASRETVAWCSIGVGLIGTGLAVAGWGVGFLAWWQCALLAGVAVVAVGLWTVEAGAGPAAHKRRRLGALWVLALGGALVLVVWSGRGAWWFDSALLAAMITIGALNVHSRVSSDPRGDEARYSDGLILADPTTVQDAIEEEQP